MKQSPATQHITIGDLILFALCRVLPGYPALNAHLIGDTLRCFEGVHLGVAVDTARGLLVPVLLDAQRLSLPELSRAVRELAGQARTGKIDPALLQSGSFTVSNLGALGVEQFTPVLNPPQTGILGVCSLTQRVREQNGVVQCYPAMGLSLSYDHRALDGAPAARFMGELCSYLEQIESHRDMMGIPGFGASTKE